MAACLIGDQSMNQMQMQAKEEALNSFFDEVMKPYFLSEYENIQKPEEKPMVEEKPEVMSMPDKVMDIEDDYKEEPKAKLRGPSISIIDIAMKPKKENPKKRRRGRPRKKK